MSSYYAADGQIARAPIPGGIEITAQEYKDALDGMLAGRVVQIVEGSLVVDFPSPPEPEPPDPPDFTAPTILNVDIERNRRIADEFFFGGVRYQLDPYSQMHVTAMGADALFAVAGGAQAGNYRWADPDNDFGWIATDNTVVLMDAPTMAAFAMAAKLWVSRHIHAARAIKDAIEAGNPPADVTDNNLWV